MATTFAYSISRRELEAALSVRSATLTIAVVISGVNIGIVPAAMTRAAGAYIGAVSVAWDMGFSASESR